MTQNLDKRLRGIQTPDFIIGTLGDALCHTVNVTGDNLPWSEMKIEAEDRKTCVIYVNHDQSISKNIFLTNTMFIDPVFSLLRKTINWCWDITMDENKTKFYEMIDKYFNPEKLANQDQESLAGLSNFQRRMMMSAPLGSGGVEVSRLLRSIAIADYPLFLVCSMDEENRRRPVISQIIKSNMTPEEVYTKMESAITDFSGLCTRLKIEEAERLNREKFRKEQSQEYEKSIQNDIAKQTEKIDQENLEKAKAQEVKDQANKIAREKEECENFIKKLDSKTKKLAISEICNIKMKMADGSTQTKKFPAKESVKVIFKWAKSLGFPDCTITQRMPRVKLNDYLDRNDVNLKKLFGETSQLMLEDNLPESSDDENDDSSGDDSD